MKSVLKIFFPLVNPVVRHFSKSIISSSQSWESWEYGSFNHKDVPIEKDINSNFPIPSPYTPFWDTFSDEEVSKGIEILRNYASFGRLDKCRKVLETRTQSVRFVFENPSNANNAWACLRTLDSFGVQFVDVIREPSSQRCYRRKVTMQSALGSQKWMSLVFSDNTTQCLNNLKKDGFHIMVSDLHEQSSSFDAIDWSAPKYKKVAIVMGNEERGVTDEARQCADETFFIPMRGFSESLNLAAATASIVSSLHCKERLVADVAPLTQNRIMLMWLARSVEGSHALLRRGGLDVKTDISSS